MTQRVLGPTGSRRRRRTLVVPFLLVVVVGLLLTAGAQAVHDVGEFELDKNATNNLNVTAFGTLGANVNASTTTIPVCRTAPEQGFNFTILVEAERMLVKGVAGGTFGGNCSGTKVNYTVDRGHDGTTAASHSKSGEYGYVSLLQPETKDGPDWNQVYQTIGSDPDCSSLDLVECSFVEDGIGPTTFIGGASKDHLPISGWMHTSGASPDKAEILNAYAAKAIDDNGDQILYFGMDRYAVDGSTDIGFWFFRDEVTANPDGTFTGTHQGTLNSSPADNDILALATFTQGGAATNIRVFRWVGSGGNESGTIQGPDADAGDCVQDPPLTNDKLCGTVANTTIEVPWNYQFKGAATGRWVPTGGLFEGGINLSQLGLEGCFSSFLAETRSSPEITAILKDFTIGSFEACDTSVVTTPANGAGTALTDSSDSNDVSPLPDIKIGTGNTGVLVTDTAAVTVNGLSTWTGTVSFFLCGPLSYEAVGDPPAVPLCTTGGVPAGTKNVSNSQTTATSDQLKLTSVGRYCWRGVFTPSTQSASDGLESATDASPGECFEVIPVTPTLTTTAVDCTSHNVLTGPVDFPGPFCDKAALGGTANKPATNGTSPYPSILAASTSSNGSAATGQITFTLLGPDGPSQVGCPAQTTVATGTNPQTVNVTNGNGNYFTSAVTVSAPGTYHWQASYDGDSPNTTGASHNTACDEAAEEVTVRQIPTELRTKQSWYPNDTAEIKSSVSGDAIQAGGTVDFFLYDNATCTGTLKYSQRVTIAAGDISSGVATVSTTNYPGGNGTTPSGGTWEAFKIDTLLTDANAAVNYSWKVVYTPAAGDTTHLGRQSACTAGSTEKFSITYTNDDSGGTALP